MTNKNKLIALLEKKYPDLSIFENGNGWTSNSEDVFAISAEDNVMSSQGHDLLNYWDESHKYWDLGIHHELVEFLEKHGWYAEWVNPGVVAIVKD
jgi:hypothetical protein